MNGRWGPSVDFLYEDALLKGSYCTHFIPNSNEIDTRFMGTDDPRSYDKNMKDPVWKEKWENVCINYDMNSNGYRTKEFTDIDWEESVVIFGDSCVLGMGVPEEDTVSMQLQEHIKRPVINLGVGGCSNQFTMFNNMRFLSQFKPFALINIWTEPSRSTTFSAPMVGNTGVDHWGSWSLPDEGYVKYWLKNEVNYHAWTSLCMHTCATLNKDNRYLNYTPRGAEEHRDPFLDGEFPFYKGAARDKLHPDVYTYSLQARYILGDFVRYGWLD